MSIPALVGTVECNKFLCLNLDIDRKKRAQLIGNKFPNIWLLQMCNELFKQRICLSKLHINIGKHTVFHPVQFQLEDYTQS